MFVGRDRELAYLNNLYASQKLEFVVIYGRRRVGKTALIRQFIKNKKAIYFMGVESNAAQNLENLSRNIFAVLNSIDADTVFASFQSALEYVFQKAQEERIILVIDEYPYIARAVASLASTLQLLLDKYVNSKLMLVLCGSSMSYMEDKVLAYKAPLYGRRTGQMKILPFNFAEACRYFANFSAEDKALLYGIAGGTPQYLLQMREELSVADNIKNTFLNPNSILFEEPESLLKQEVREPAMYNAIITAIANGATRMADIAAKVGESTSVCVSYIKSLISLGIVKKEYPYGDAAVRKSLYMIADNMFRFWYRFVPMNSSIIALGASDLAYKRIEPYLSEYMGPVFEDICRQYLWNLQLLGQTPLIFSDLGRWWGTDKDTKKQVEIDIMGAQDKHTALFGECKWINEKVDAGVLETLLQRSRLFHYETVYLYLFAKKGFTEACVQQAQSMGNVYLITYNDIINRI